MKPGQPGGWIREIYDFLGLRRELEWLHKRINEVFTVGDIVFDRTLTPETETGAKTINKLAGTVRFAAAATSLTVTNSFCKETSIVFAVVKTGDATAYIRNVVPSDGSFTIRLGAAATAETEVGWLVTN